MVNDMEQWLKDRTRRLLAPVARLATRNRARVLMYHRFGPRDSRKLPVDALESQLRYLRHHFNIVPLSDLVTRLKSGTAFEPSTIALTVDDAYADFGEHAYPVFRKYGIPVTLYVVSEFAGGKFWLWWDAIRYLLNQSGNGCYRFKVAGAQVEIVLSDLVSRDQAWLKLAEHGIKLTPGQRELYLVDLQNAFSLSLPRAPTHEFAALPWDELRVLDPEIVEIGAHTRTHPILSRCDSLTIVEEILGSKEVIEDRLGIHVSAFCYPNGNWPDIDGRCIDVVRDVGFDSAVMACGSMIGMGANLYMLERMSPSYVSSEFESDISGVAYLRDLIIRRAEAYF